MLADVATRERTGPAEAKSEQLLIRVGLPQPSGQLVGAARTRGYPVLFSANAFATTYPRGHEREGYFRAFRLPRAGQLAGLSAALDSGGFVSAVRYRDFRWSVEAYYDLVAAHPWDWHASMDYCCEPEIADDRPTRLLRMAATVGAYRLCCREAAHRGLPAPMPVIQGWTADEYLMCLDWLALPEDTPLIGVGSVCRRHLHGPDGLLAVVSAIDSALPSSTRLHLFGVKSQALQVLSKSSRVASVDSMAWDAQARAERRTGRSAAFRIGHMDRWTTRQAHGLAAAGAATGGLQAQLFAPSDLRPVAGVEARIHEAIAMHHADLVMDGDVEYLDALWSSHHDAVHAVAAVRLYGFGADSREVLDGIYNGLADVVESAAAA